MRLSASGQLLLGLGDGRVSVSGVDVARGGKIVPLSTSTAVFQQTGDHDASHLAQVDLGNLAVTTLEATAISYLRANAGTYAISITPGGTHTNTGFAESGGLMLDVGPDGWLFVTTYQLQTDVRIYRPVLGSYVLDQSLTTPAFFSDGFGPCFRALSNGRAAWADAALRLHVNKISVVNPTWPIFSVVPVDLDGTIYLLELGNERLTLRPAHSLNGWIVATGDTFAPDAMALNGQILIGWSTTQGEMPGNGRSRSIDISSPTVPLGLPHDPGPTPDPDPDPEPEPEPIPMPDSLLAALQAERAKYGPGMTNDECVALLDAVAARHAGWGLLSKSSGNNGRRRDGALCSVDHLVYKPLLRGVDCLSDAGAGGPSTPTWNDDPNSWEAFPVERFIAPLGGAEPVPDPDPEPVPDPTPTPQPQPKPCDLAPVLSALQVAQQEHGALLMRVAELQTQVAELLEKPAPNYSGKVLGFAVTLRPSS